MLRNLTQQADTRLAGKDHGASVGRHAVERYLLNDLSAAERDAFEQHYFECPSCAQDVRLAFGFADSARAVLREDGAQPIAAPTPEPFWWLMWLRPANMAPVAACLSLALLAGYQNLVTIPRLRASAPELKSAQLLPSARLVPATRASLPAVHLPAGASFFQLSLDTPISGTFEKYEWSLRAASGRSLHKLPVPAMKPDDDLQVLVPAKDVEAGRYEVLLRGIAAGQSQEVERYRFTVHR
jgi:hypothetical protein